MSTTKPEGTLDIAFDSGLEGEALVKVRDNLSAIAWEGDFLWLGGDEGTRLHRMARDASGNFSGHRTFELCAVLALPGGNDEEVDIEGLAFDSGYLWLVGSHSAKRKKADKEKSCQKNLARLAEVGVDGNRFTLARVPLDDRAEPAVDCDGRCAARLRGDAAGNVLTEALLRDPHLGAFVPRVLQDGSVEGIPSKDNGFDIEGLAVAGDRVFVGLRGPVLRGWATILELRVTQADGGVLELEPLGADGQVYLKHFLELDGLGIRELAIDGADLVVLAGPSMDLDGPVFIYRWAGALDVGRDSLTWRDELSRPVSVPFGIGDDHAEGMTFVPGRPGKIVVCYDSPGKGRVHDNGRCVKLDLFGI